MRQYLSSSSPLESDTSSLILLRLFESNADDEETGQEKKNTPKKTENRTGGEKLIPHLVQQPIMEKEDRDHEDTNDSGKPLDR